MCVVIVSQGIYRNQERIPNHRIILEGEWIVGMSGCGNVTTCAQSYTVCSGPTVCPTVHTR